VYKELFDHDKHRFVLRAGEAEAVKVEEALSVCLKCGGGLGT
jgi:hypothetical protein